MMTSYCSKLMEIVRTEISIAMLCIFNTLDAIMSVLEDDLLLIIPAMTAFTDQYIACPIFFFDIGQL